MQEQIAIIIHARHWQDDYTVPCRWLDVATIVSEINIPVIANGDVSDLNALRTVLAHSNCDGIMISRASMGVPWLFQQLMDPRFVVPTIAQQGLLLLQHVKRLMLLEN